MTIPTTFHARVAEDAITKVSRLFNASLDDVFAELFQNARRAGATSINVSKSEHPDLGSVIVLVDDGPGLSDPEDLFTLGHSAWDDDTQRLEDAAGMGFFALSGRKVRILAQQAGTARSWQIDAEPESFSGIEPITCADGPPDHHGTTIFITAKPGENFIPAANHAARYFPLEVTVDGVTAPRKDFLAEAELVETWNGIRIGVYDKTPNNFRDNETLNFHGVTLCAKLPSVSQQFHRAYHARLDVIDCARLKLVLPARKEVVENEFYDELRAHITTLFYRLIAQADAHSLTFKDQQRASVLGVELPPAKMALRVFKSSHADTDQTCFGSVEPVTAASILFDSNGGAIEEQNLASALSHDGQDMRLYDPNTAFEGYGWYDGLVRLSVNAYQLIMGTEVTRVEPEATPAFADRPDRLAIEVCLTGASSTETRLLETDWLLLGEDFSCLDEVCISVTNSSKATSPDLVDFLEQALFCPSDDVEAGSYDQQIEWFRNEAEDLAINMLETSLDADINAVTRVLDRDLFWLRRRDGIVTIRIGKGAIEISGLGIDPAEPVP